MLAELGASIRAALGKSEIRAAGAEAARQALVASTAVMLAGAQGGEAATLLREAAALVACAIRERDGRTGRLEGDA